MTLLRHVAENQWKKAVCEEDDFKISVKYNRPRLSGSRSLFHTQWQKKTLFSIDTKIKAIIVNLNSFCQMIRLRSWESHIVKMNEK